MCEQCASRELEGGRLESAIRECPRLRALGESTVDWLTCVATEHAGSSSRKIAKTPTILRLPLRVAAVVLLGTAMVLEAIGVSHLIVGEEWRGGASLGLMVLGCFVLILSRYAADG